MRCETAETSSTTDAKSPSKKRSARSKPSRTMDLWRWQTGFSTELVSTTAIGRSVQSTFDAPPRFRPSARRYYRSCRLARHEHGSAGVPAACQLADDLLIYEATGYPDRGEAGVYPARDQTCRVLAQGLAVVPVLRAGLGMLDPILHLFPDVSVGYIGLERDHKTAIAHSYYCKLPTLTGRYTLCVDPMLATGGSASQAITLLKSHGASPVVMVCVISAPEGVARLQADHPDVDIITAAHDRELNEHKYILPGLGDFGDRLFGTM
ncbi:MAG: uracil phosphoribosyltransferase [Fimbriimonadales bacterium]